SAWRETTSRGAKSYLEFAEAGTDEDGVLRRSAVHTYGEVIHSFIDRSDYHGPCAPGFRKIKKPAAAAHGLSLLEVDHCVGNVELGDMNKYVDFYRGALGFTQPTHYRDTFGATQLTHYDDKVIHTDYSALMSKVMTNGNGRIKFPINEPATGKKK